MHQVLFENVTVIELVMTFAVKNAVFRHVVYFSALLATVEGRIQNEGVENRVVRKT
jgi:hypothetical protein